jgi:hypothetical protein
VKSLRFVLEVAGAKARNPYSVPQSSSSAPPFESPTPHSSASAAIVEMPGPRRPRSRGPAPARTSCSGRPRRECAENDAPHRSVLLDDLYCTAVAKNRGPSADAWVAAIGSGQLRGPGQTSQRRACAEPRSNVANTPLRLLASANSYSTRSGRSEQREPRAAAACRRVLVCGGSMHFVSS